MTKLLTMKLSTLATVLALLVLAPLVCCEDDIVKEIASEVAKEVEGTVDEAAATVCQAFPLDEHNQPEHQQTKRGFWKSLWKGIKTVAVGAAVTAVLGKRESRPWKNVNGTVPDWRRPWWKNRTELAKNARELQDEAPTDLCESEFQKQIEKLEKSIEVLGTMTNLVQSLKQCNKPDNSP